MQKKIALARSAAEQERAVEKKVYLLEDDANIGELVKCALEMSNIQIECYETVASFMAAVEKSAPAAALLDIMLPD